MLKRLTLFLSTLLTTATAVFAEVPSGNPLVWGNNRLTIITPTLFRLEYAKDAAFIDAPTMLAYNRDSRLSPDQFTVTETAPGKFEINTGVIRLQFEDDGYPFNTSNFRAYYTLNGKETKFTTRFIKKNNLGGPVETLDRVTKEIPMNDGILSTDGWYMIDDERSDLLVDGWLQPRDTRNHIQDMYCFVYGNDYKAALRSLGELSGYVPMPRKYIHGIWYCRYWDYTADEFIGILDEYKQHDFPIDNLVMDMGWHTNDATIGAGHNALRNWTGYTWNRELIPDPQALIDEIHRRGVTVSLNDHPHDALRPHEATYNDFITELNPKDGQTPLFDLSDRRYMDIFFRHSHLPHEKMGVDFWWLDWQQNYLYPYVRGTNTTTLSWINHLYFTRLERDGRRGQGYSRWAGWGDHRYPIQFSGDAQANWPMLAFEVKLSALSGNAGCYFWAHDIGGFRGAPNQELSVRWTQFGAFSAALRVHSTKDAKLDRRPWLSDKRHTDAMRRMYHMRAEMMPYVYSSVWQVHSTMVPLNRPMFIDYGHDKKSFDQHQQFMFGDLILAAPITSPGKGKDLMAEQTVWFPDGDTWYDFFTHERKQGGQALTIAKPLEEFPLYQKAGYVLPMQPYSERPASQTLTTLVMRVYPSDSDVEANSYTLYEDDGISTGYKEGKSATTLLTYSRQGNNQKVTIAPTQGSYDGQPLQRAYRLQLPAINKINSVKVNGRKVKATYNNDMRCHIVEIPASDIRKTTTIEYN